MPSLRRFARAAGAALAGVMVAVASPAVARAQEPLPSVAQIGTYDYLQTPNFAGLGEAGRVLHGSTLGLGTFDGLTGELVMVGGKAYRVNVDGTPTSVDPHAGTPFVQAVDFRAQASAPVAPGTTCAQLADSVNALAGTTQGVVAVRVRGTFTSLVARSVPGFAAPYPTLADAVAQQVKFDLPGRRAVLVGFRTGPDFAGVGAPGLHLHGVTADRSAGGHVLSCVAGGDVQLSIERTAGVTIVD